MKSFAALTAAGMALVVVLALAGAAGPAAQATNGLPWAGR